MRNADRLGAPIGLLTVSRVRMGAKPEITLNARTYNKNGVLHEMGHAFGLLDTYVMANNGFQGCNLGQPDAVMCSTVHSR